LQGSAGTFFKPAAQLCSRFDCFILRFEKWLYVVTLKNFIPVDGASGLMCQ
jgi:hypothetical protein